MLHGAFYYFCSHPKTLISSWDAAFVNRRVTYTAKLVCTYLWKGLQSGSIAASQHKHGTPKTPRLTVFSSWLSPISETYPNYLPHHGYSEGFNGRHSVPWKKEQSLHDAHTDALSSVFVSRLVRRLVGRLVVVSDGSVGRAWWCVPKKELYGL